MGSVWNRSTQKRSYSRSPSDHWCSVHSPASPDPPGPCDQGPNVGRRPWQPGGSRPGQNGSGRRKEQTCCCWLWCPTCSDSAPAFPVAPTRRTHWGGDPPWPPETEQTAISIQLRGKKNIDNHFFLNPDAHSTTCLSVSQVCVSSKQDSDIVRGVRHPLHHHSQLFHPLLGMVFTALQVRRHQTQLLAFEIHLNEEQDLTTTPAQI